MNLFVILSFYSNVIILTNQLKFSPNRSVNRISSSSSSSVYK